MTKRIVIIGSALSSKKVHQMSAFANTLKNRFLQIPKSVRLGVVGVSLVYISTAGLYFMSLPWVGAADSERHVDYVYQVYNGKIADPKRYQDLFIDVSERPQYATYKTDGMLKRNGAAHTPPLHYMIMAAFSGKVLDDGHWKQAVSIMRTVNIFIGLLCVLVLAWAGWTVGGRYREYFAVATPAFSILIATFVRVSSDIYNDSLVVLLSTSAMLATIILLKNGPKISYIVALAIICSLGMLAKATFLSTLLLVILFMVVSYIIHNKDKVRAIKYAFGANLLVILSVLLTSGWFYWRNFQLSGSFVRSFPKIQTGTRHENDLIDILTNQHFWAVIPESLFGNYRSGSAPLSLFVFTLAFIGVAIIAIRFMKRQNTKKLPSKSHTIGGAILALMLLQVVALYAQQLQHSIGWGQLNIRYLLNGLLPIGLYFTIASLVIGRCVRYVMPVIIILYSTYAIRDVIYFRTDFDTNLNGVISAVSANGLSPHLIYLPIIVLMIGVILVFVSTSDITNRLFADKKQRRKV